MTKQYKTKRRGRSRRRTGTRSRVKRGGMLARAVSQSAKIATRKYFYEKVIPLLIEYDTNVGQNPQPSDGSVVPFSQRYYRSFADIPMDDGIKESIRELKKEINNPVKNLDKMKTAYEKLMKTLEDEKRKQPQKENGGQSLYGSFSTFSSSPFSPTPRPSFSTSANIPYSATAAAAAAGLVNPPFHTPDIRMRPGYSTDAGTPDKPPSKSDNPYYPHANDMEVIDPRRVLEFVDYSTPVKSPPPNPSSDPHYDTAHNNAFSPVRMLYL